MSGSSANESGLTQILFALCYHGVFIPVKDTDNTQVNKIHELISNHRKFHKENKTE